MNDKEIFVYIFMAQRVFFSVMLTMFMQLSSRDGICSIRSTQDILVSIKLPIKSFLKLSRLLFSPSLYLTYIYLHVRPACVTKSRAEVGPILPWHTDLSGLVGLRLPVNNHAWVSKFQQFETPLCNQPPGTGALYHCLSI